MSDQKVIAIVPMRGDSKRVPGKNTRPLAGKPLFHHIVETLARAESVSRVVVDTDSDELWAEVEERFPEVQLLRRPEPLAGDFASAHEIVRNTVEQLEGEHFLQTHSTNPLLSAETVDRAVAAYFAGRPEHDSLFTVTAFYKRFFTAGGEPVNHDPRGIVRTQDLEPVLEENSCLYVFDRDTILDRRMRIGERPQLFRMEAAESVDIDDEVDLVIAQAILDARSSAPRAS
jgi:CMP-N-acetylneuraminic acid synthetase